MLYRVRVLYVHGVCVSWKAVGVCEGGYLCLGRLASSCVMASSVGGLLEIGSLLQLARVPVYLLNHALDAH